MKIEIFGKAGTGVPPPGRGSLVQPAPAATLQILQLSTHLKMCCTALLSTHLSVMWCTALFSPDLCKYLRTVWSSMQWCKICAVGPDGNWTSNRLTSAPYLDIYCTYVASVLHKCIVQVYCRSVLGKCILQVFCASVVCFCISSLSYLCPDGKWASAPSSTSDGIIRHVRKIRLCCRAHGYYQMTSQLCLKCWTAKMEHKICLAAQEQCASCAHIATGLLLSVRGPIHNR